MYLINGIGLFLITLGIIPNSIVYILFFLNVMISIKDKRLIDLIIISLIMPSEIINFLGVFTGVIFIICKSFQKRGKIIISKKIKKIDIVYSIYLIIFGLVNCFYTGAAFNTLISLCYFLSFIILNRVNFTNKNEISLDRILKNVLIIQMFCMIGQFIKYQKYHPSDVYKGSFQSAHYVAVFLSITLIYFLSKKLNKENILFSIITLILLFFTEGKHVYYSLIISLGLVNFLDFIKIKRNKIMIIGITIIISLFTITNVENITKIKEFITSLPYNIYDYVYTYPYNTKFDYIDISLNQNLTGKDLFVGIGLGEYGSRIANMRAYDIMEKSSDISRKIEKFIPPHVSEKYAPQAIKYDREFVVQLKNMSAVLAYPFNSITSIIMESGLIGYILILLWLNNIGNICKNKGSDIIITFVMIILLFDSYLDIPSVFVLSIVLLNLYNNEERGIL